VCPAHQEGGSTFETVGAGEKGVAGVEAFAPAQPSVQRIAATASNNFFCNWSFTLVDEQANLSKKLIEKAPQGR
jgi:hypothetical protein